MRLIYVFIILILAISCSESQMLQKSLNKNSIPIGYLHNSKNSNLIMGDPLAINFKSKALDSIITVKDIKNKVFPFLVLTVVDNEMSVKLGQKVIQQDYNEFFLKSLTEESVRNGYSTPNRTKSDSTYTLNVNIDSCYTHSKYKINTTVIFLLVGYSYSSYETGAPSETVLQVSAELKKGNSIIGNKTYYIKREQPFFNQYRQSLNKMRADFTTNMIESLSYCTKQCIDQIITDTNTLINEDKVKTQTVLLK